MFDRIVGALTFRRGIYNEVEKEHSFTSKAWIFVAVVALLNQLGTQSGFAAQEGPITWLLVSLVNTSFVLLGFTFAVWITSWLGRTVYNAEVDFHEMVRVLGLAYVWNIVGLLGLIALGSPLMQCIINPIAVVAIILGLIAWLIAIREALDLDWIPTITILVLGWIVSMIVRFIGLNILAAMGLTASGMGGFFFY